MDAGDSIVDTPEELKERMLWLILQHVCRSVYLSTSKHIITMIWSEHLCQNNLDFFPFEKSMN